MDKEALSKLSKEELKDMAFPHHSNKPEHAEVRAEYEAWRKANSAKLIAIQLMDADALRFDLEETMWWEHRYKELTDKQSELIRAIRNESKRSRQLIDAVRQMLTEPAMRMQ